jgi:hypothetical protein
MSTTLQESYDLLLKSQKFIVWGTPLEKIRPQNPALSVGEKHFTPQELAAAWGVSNETIRVIFRSEPGVLKIGKPGSNRTRGYVTLRIPHEVAERVHKRLSAAPESSSR